MILLVGNGPVGGQTKGSPSMSSTLTIGDTSTVVIDGKFIEDDEVIVVDGTSGYRSIHGYDDDGSLMDIGVIRYRDFDPGGGMIRSLTLESNLSGKDHHLGTVSRGFQSYSPAQVIRPFLNAGFEPRKMIYNGTGTRLIATLSRPDVTFEDVIGWDKNLLNGIEGLNVDGTTMELAVRVKTDLHAGQATRVDVGFWRLVCTNGLVSQVLSLGKYWSNHRNFSSIKLQQFALAATASMDDMPTAPTKLLDDVLDVLDRIDAESASIPRLLRAPAQAVSEACHNGKGDALKSNLLALRSGQETMTKLDLVNAQTNIAHTARSQWNVYNQTDVVVSALTDLVDLAGVRRGVPTFEFAAN